MTSEQMRVGECAEWLNRVRAAERLLHHIARAAAAEKRELTPALVQGLTAHAWKRAAACAKCTPPHEQTKVMVALMVARGERGRLP